MKLSAIEAYTPSLPNSFNFHLLLIGHAPYQISCCPNGTHKQDIVSTFREYLRSMGGVSEIVTTWSTIKHVLRKGNWVLWKPREWDHFLPVVGRVDHGWSSGWGTHWLCWLLGVWSWACYFTSLSLRLVSYKVKILLVTLQRTAASIRWGWEREEKLRLEHYMCLRSVNSLHPQI